MRAVQNHPATELQLVVTGTHLVRDFGYSVDLIRQDGFPIAGKIPMYRGSEDARRELPASLARLVDKLGKWLLKNESDFVVVLGDRVEALGGALAGMTANVPVAHLHGGELATGDMDDRIRFAISSMASLHFVASQESKRRLLRAGEPADRIFVVGAMAIDEIFEARRSFDRQQKQTFRDRYQFSMDKPLLVVVLHPSGYGAETEFRYMTGLLKEAAQYQGLIIGPNNDPGHSGIRRAIEKFMTVKKNQQSWRFVENIPRQEYLLAVATADALVGNSSSGIIEANALGTAVVNIGPRQAGRERNGRAIFDCDYDRNAIQTTLTQVSDWAKSHNIHSGRRFGTGQAGETITKILAETQRGRELLVKPHL
jgi:UDP-hydrolysing UDP-N-acetyl-D-glucosamine 2-epimerase